MFKLLYEPYPFPIKKQAIKVLVLHLRQFKKGDQQEFLLRQLLGKIELIREIKDDKSFFVRILFFDICHEVLIVFSQRFFRSYFFISYLSLSRDLIPNIRLRFIALLPLVRYSLNHPDDLVLLSKLIEVAETLLRDPDDEVAEAMASFVKIHGDLSSEDCCSKQAKSGDDFGLMSLKITLKKARSSGSLTDRYLFEAPRWNDKFSAEEELVKEEHEQSLAFFQLDPLSKHRDAASRPIRRVENSKKIFGPTIIRKAISKEPISRALRLRKGYGIKLI